MTNLVDVLSENDLACIDLEMMNQVQSYLEYKENPFDISHIYIS